MPIQWLIFVIYPTQDGFYNHSQGYNSVYVTNFELNIYIKVAEGRSHQARQALMDHTRLS